jgi:hypothetical protein
MMNMTELSTYLMIYIFNDYCTHKKGRRAAQRAAARRVLELLEGAEQRHFALEQRDRAAPEGP